MITIELIVHIVSLVAGIVEKCREMHNKSTLLVKEMLFSLSLWFFQYEAFSTAKDKSENYIRLRSNVVCITTEYIEIDWIFIILLLCRSVKLILRCGNHQKIHR